MKIIIIAQIFFEAVKSSTLYKCRSNNYHFQKIPKRNFQFSHTHKALFKFRIIFPFLHSYRYFLKNPIQIRKPKPARIVFPVEENGERIKGLLFQIFYSSEFNHQKNYFFSVTQSNVKSVLSFYQFCKLVICPSFKHIYSESFEIKQPYCKLHPKLFI